MLGLIDRIVAEPIGGAHRDYDAMMENVRTALKDELSRFKSKSIKSLLVTRYERLMSYGKFKEVASK